MNEAERAFRDEVLAADRDRRRELRERRRHDLETMDYARFARRVVQRYGERLAEADYPDLADALEVLEDLEQAVAVGVRAQADRGSWATVALGLGITRQGAWQRFGRPRRAVSSD